MERAARHVLVTGRVQGVGFRWFVREEARALGLAGWVKNLRDGRVEAWLEGAPEAVAAMIERIRAGRRPAQVEDVAVDERPASGLAQFEVR